MHRIPARLLVVLHAHAAAAHYDKFDVSLGWFYIKGFMVQILEFGVVLHIGVYGADFRVWGGFTYRGLWCRF
jgi:hypothetical protein